jgi:mono/diheme cytochrome c family protein
VHRFLLSAAFAALFTLGFSSAAMAQAGAEPYPLLPPGPGRDVETRVCSQCHSPEFPAKQAHDLAGWNDLIGKMQINGAEASDEEFDQIAAYLAKSFPPK